VETALSVFVVNPISTTVSQQTAYTLQLQRLFCLKTLTPTPRLTSVRSTSICDASPFLPRGSYAGSMCFWQTGRCVLFPFGLFLAPPQAAATIRVAGLLWWGKWLLFLPAAMSRGLELLKPALLQKQSPKLVNSWSRTAFPFHTLISGGSLVPQGGGIPQVVENLWW